jgi:hypothetical protein
MVAAVFQHNTDFKILSNTMPKMLVAWHERRKRVKSASHGGQDITFAEIKSSATLSLGRIEHSKFSARLEKLSASRTSYG